MDRESPSKQLARLLPNGYARFFVGLCPSCFLEYDGDYCIQNIKDKDNRIYRIECGIHSRWFCIKTRNDDGSWNAVYTNEKDNNEIIDIEDDGGRWEGSVMNGEPLGYGSLYDANGELRYSGYIYHGCKVGLGCDYYGDGTTIAYYGGFLNGERCGYGILYDRHQNTVYEGPWLYQVDLSVNSVVIHKENECSTLIHSLLKELTIEGVSSYDLRQFRIEGYPFLKKLHIGENCLQWVYQFRVSHCLSLEAVTIETGCFSHTGYDMGIPEECHHLFVASLESKYDLINNDLIFLS